MTKTKIQSGAVIYWSLVDQFDLERLKSGWSALGYEKHVPEQRSPLVCLKDALNEVVADKETLICPLKAGNGYAVVREAKGEDENQYQTIFNSRVPQHSNIPVFSVSGETVDRVTEAFHKYRRTATAAQVSGKLVNILYQLNGTRLRNSGGVYWISGSALDDWELAATVMINAGMGVPQAYVIEHELTPGAVLAVKDGLVNDIQTRIAQLHAEIGSGEMGARGLEARQADIVELQNKVLDYEQMLDVSLVDIKKGLESLSTATATAQMMLMAIHNAETSPYAGVGSDS
jgi:hypothetical protein